MARTSMLLLLLRALLISVSVECFQIGVVQSLRQSTLLFSEPRQPRRNLKKVNDAMDFLRVRVSMINVTLTPGDFAFNS